MKSQKPQQQSQQMALFPFDDVVAQVERDIELGARIHQQFICGSCGTKQTMEQPNAMFKAGRCEECNQITDIEAAGCNYLAIFETTAH